MTIDLDEKESNAVLIALAYLGIERPSWDASLLPIADKLRGGVAEYRRFQSIRRGALRLRAGRKLKAYAASGVGGESDNW